MRQIDEEVTEITDRVLHEPPARNGVFTYLYSEKVDPCSREFEAAPQFRGEPRTMVDSINQTLAEEMRRNANVIVFGEDVADCSREQNLPAVKGKGGVFKATAVCSANSAACGVSIRLSLKQESSGVRSGWRSRHEASSRDSIFRLHLARDDADSRRTRKYTVAIKQRVLLPDGDSRSHRRISDRRIDLPQPMRGGYIHTHPRIACGFSVERTGRLRPAAHRDSMRRPCSVPGAQEALPGAVQSLSTPRSGFHGSVRESENGEAGSEPYDRHVRSAGAKVAAGGPANGSA